MRQRRQDSELRKSVLARDKHTCQLCFKKKRARYLQVHHIRMWSRSAHLRFEPGNCVSLCIPCHKSIRGKEHHYESYFMRIINGG